MSGGGDPQEASRSFSDKIDQNDAMADSSGYGNEKWHKLWSNDFPVDGENLRTYKINVSWDWCSGSASQDLVIEPNWENGPNRPGKGRD